MADIRNFFGGGGSGASSPSSGNASTSASANSTNAAHKKATAQSRRKTQPQEEKRPKEQKEIMEVEIEDDDDVDEMKVSSKRKPTSATRKRRIILEEDDDVFIDDSHDKRSTTKKSKPTSAKGDNTDPTALINLTKEMNNRKLAKRSMELDDEIENISRDKRRRETTDFSLISEDNALEDLMKGPSTSFSNVTSVKNAPSASSKYHIDAADFFGESPPSFPPQNTSLPIPKPAPSQQSRSPQTPQTKQESRMKSPMKAAAVSRISPVKKPVRAIGNNYPSPPSPPAKKLPTEDTLWVNRHRPKQVSDIVGNGPNVDRIKKYLETFEDLYVTKKQKPKFRENYRAILITGPPGIGKTTAAHLVAESQGYHVVEFNASDTRNKSSLEHVVGEMTINRGLREYFHNSQSSQSAMKNNNKISKTCIIMDEVDGMCWGRGTKLMLYDGTSMKVEDIYDAIHSGRQVFLMGDDSQPRKIFADSLIHGNTAVDKKRYDDERKYKAIYLKRAESLNISVKSTSSYRPGMYRIISNNKGRSEWCCIGNHVLVLKINRKPWIELSDAHGPANYQVRRYISKQGSIAGTTELAIETVSLFDNPSDAQAFIDKELEHRSLVIQCTVDQYIALNPTWKADCMMYQPDAVHFSPPPVSLNHRISSILKRAATDHEIESTAWVLGVYLVLGHEQYINFTTDESKTEKVIGLDVMINKINEWNGFMNQSDSALTGLPHEYTRKLLGDDDDDLEPQRTLNEKPSGFDTKRVMINGGMSLGRLVHDYRLDNSKFPMDLLRENLKVRQYLLSGIIDACGQYTTKHKSYVLECSRDRTFVDKVIHLARGLGLVTGIVRKHKSNGSSSYRFHITGPNLDDFIHPVSNRNKCPIFDHESNQMDYRCDGFDVEEASDGDYYGFKASGNGRLLMTDFVVTHNCGNEDRGGMQELMALIKNTKTPIITIANDSSSPKIRSLKNHVLHLTWRRPTSIQMTPRLTQIAKREGMQIDNEAINRLHEATQGDFRAILNAMQMFRSTNASLTSGFVKESMNAANKDFDVGPFTIVPDLFKTPDKSLARSWISERQNLYFVDADLMPLFVQQNYLRASPSGTNTPVATMGRFSEAANWISEADIVSAHLRSEQDYSFMPLHAVMSTVAPAWCVAGHLSGRIDFPMWLGQFSSRNKKLRLLRELRQASSAELHVSDSYSFALDYIQLLRNYILKPIREKSGQGAQEAIDVLDEYGFTREDLDSLLELTDPFLSEEARDGDKQLLQGPVKGSITRLYNKGSHMMTITRSSMKGADVTRTRGTKVTLDGLEEDEEPDIEEEEEGEENGEDGDAAALKKDSMIAANTSSTTSTRGARGGKGSRGGRGGRGGAATAAASSSPPSAEMKPARGGTKATRGKPKATRGGRGGKAGNQKGDADHFIVSDDDFD